MLYHLIFTCSTHYLFNPKASSWPKQFITWCGSYRGKVIHPTIRLSRALHVLYKINLAFRRPPFLLFFKQHTASWFYDRDYSSSVGGNEKAHPMFFDNFDLSQDERDMEGQEMTSWQQREYKERYQHQQQRRRHSPSKSGATKSGGSSSSDGGGSSFFRSHQTAKGGGGGGRTDPSHHHQRQRKKELSRVSEEPSTRSSSQHLTIGSKDQAGTGGPLPSTTLSFSIGDGDISRSGSHHLEMTSPYSSQASDYPEREAILDYDQAMT